MQPEFPHIIRLYQLQDQKLTKIDVERKEALERWAFDYFKHWFISSLY
jgi:hypothetical protein